MNAHAERFRNALRLPGLDGSGADLSPCGTYRYRMWRAWSPGPRLLWVMLNPSTADASVDDATIRRCIAFSRRDGYGGLTVVNLYALRSTNPRALSTATDPFGPVNGATLRAALLEHAVAVVAWGAAPEAEVYRKRDVIAWAPRGLWCLGTTKAGDPRHPVRLRADEPLVRWSEPSMLWGIE